MMASFPRKFLSIRDKSGAHHRSRSAPPANKSRPLVSDSLRNIFKSDHTKHGAGDPKEEAKETEDAKIKDVQQRLEELKITNVSLDHIRDILYTKFANGDPTKTVEFIDIEQKSSTGAIVPYDPRVQMVGAENRGYVTCYLDALLFAMFVKMDAFECILKNDFPPDDPRTKLVNLLRIWVNMLRSGKLIRTDLMMLIQNTLAECGWADAAELEQQDTSEAFGFLTETLQLPLLSLQVDLFHQGKKDKDDHKVVYERLLNLAVPPETEGKAMKLEDCLEEYFNARVDVLRDSEELKKTATAERRDSMPPLVHRNTVRIVTENSPASTVMTSSPVLMTPAHTQLPDMNGGDTITMQRIDPLERQHSSDTQLLNDAKPESPSRPPARHRSTSVIQNIHLDDTLRRSITEDSVMSRRSKRKGSTVVKAVTIPAWQFFRLIPWHAVTHNEPTSNVEVAMNFNQRPVVGICLKRYTMTENGCPKRHNTYIDIPDSLRLPHFMLAEGALDEDEDEDSPTLDSDYKLVLQSVVCHRGEALQSGHYIAFARVAPKLLTDNRRHDLDPPPDYEEAVWARFDDLDIDNRVSYVDDIKQALKVEMPYLLFYQVVPMVDNAASDKTDPEPPSYQEFKASLEESRASIATPPETKRYSAQFLADISTPAGVHQSPPSKPPSIRFSADSQRSRKSNELSSHHGSTGGESGRQSLSWNDSAVVSPAVTPDGTHSPMLNPVDESTASRLSRAAAIFSSKGKQSRSGSQTGEGRISSAMGRVAGMMRPSKEPLLDASNLNRSANTSTSRLSAEIPHSNRESIGHLEEPQAPKRNVSQRRSRKNGHGKAKEKEDEKEKENHREAREVAKNGDQPERECTVM